MVSALSLVSELAVHRERFNMRGTYEEEGLLGKELKNYKKFIESTKKYLKH